MQLLDGKAVSLEVHNRLAREIKSLDVKPCLGVVLVGEDPASQVYVRNKIKTCEKVGIESVEVRLPADVTGEQLKAEIEKLNNDKKINAYLVQLPLPDHLDKDEVLSWIDPMKDADGLTVTNLGSLFAGRPTVVPCTPNGVMEVLKHYDIPLEGKKAVVVGRSQIVGLPMAHLLLMANATVTICHSRTQNLKQELSDADIVVVAAGKPKFLGADDFNKNSVVIDVGIHRITEGDKTKLCGDVDFETAKQKVKALTPVPGGVGPMTIAMLLQNTLSLYKLQNSN